MVWQKFRRETWVFGANRTCSKGIEKRTGSWLDLTYTRSPGSSMNLYSWRSTSVWQQRCFIRLCLPYNHKTNKNKSRVNLGQRQWRPYRFPNFLVPCRILD